MTTPKSRNERIRRKLRNKKITPRDKNIGSKFVHKHNANTDPDGKHKYARNNDSDIKEFIEFYKTGESTNINKFKKIIEHLLNLSVENAGSLNLPYDLSRIDQLSKMINEQEQKNETESRMYKIIGKPYLLNNLEKLFKIMSSLGSIGASRNIIISFDGDGSANFQFENHDGDKILLDKNELDDMMSIDDDITIGFE